jgi:long-chain fatty acid transport protein
MKKVVVISLAAVSALVAGGYKIPEKSVNAVALCSANVANANRADMAYYNPANMAWGGEGNVVEADLTYIRLSPITYDPNTAGAESIESETENVFVPTLYYVSPDLGGWRAGLSVNTPAGLAKRWEDQPGKTYSHEFSLETVEVAPSLSYALSDTLAVAAGARMIYSSGVVKSAFLVSRDMEGDSIDFGYNAALSYRPDPAWKLAVTYRSKVDLTEEGDAVLYSGDIDASYNGLVVYDGEASVTVPVPAALNLAVAWSPIEATTLEFVYERTFWSSYESLDFEYAAPITEPVIAAKAFDDPIPKNWEDVGAYRLGVTHNYDRQWTAMAGVVYDETPIPEESLGFETPDSDSLTFSLGARYQVNAALNLGLAGLYSIRSDREVTNGDVDGTFEDSRVVLITAGAEYRF